MPFPGTLSPQQEDIFEESGAVFFQAGDVVLLSFVFFFFFHYYFVCFISIQRRAVNIKRESSWIACGIYLCIVLRGKGIKSHTNIDRYRGEAVR